VTRFNGSSFYINPELIMLIEHTPDTVITLTTDYKVVIQEPVEVIIDRIIDYQRQVRGDMFAKYLLAHHKEE
jgi:flagellar protein FlbD